MNAGDNEAGAGQARSLRARSRPPFEEATAVELVTGYQRGEEGALAALHSFLEPAIGGALQRYRWFDLPASLSLQDLSQQSWVMLAELAKRWRPRGSFLAYFFRSFPHLLRRYVQQAPSKRRAVEVMVLPYEDLVVAADRVQEAEPVWEVETGWPEMPTDLPPAEQRAFVLHMTEGQSFADIGRVLGVSQATAYRLYRRAVALLSNQVEGSAPTREAVPIIRLVHVLHAGAGAQGLLAGRRRTLASAGVTRREYAALMAQLEAAGAVVARGPGGRPRRLVDATPAATLARLGSPQL